MSLWADWAPSASSRAPHPAAPSTAVASSTPAASVALPTSSSVVSGSPCGGGGAAVLSVSGILHIVQNWVSSLRETLSTNAAPNLLWRFAHRNRHQILVVAVVLCVCRYWLVRRQRRCTSPKPPHPTVDLRSSRTSRATTPPPPLCNDPQPPQLQPPSSSEVPLIPVQGMSSSASSRIRTYNAHAFGTGSASSQSTTPRTDADGDGASRMLNKAVEELVRSKETRRLAVDEAGNMFVLLNRGEYVEIYDADQNGEIKNDEEDPQSEAQFAELLDHFSREASLAVEPPTSE